MGTPLDQIEADALRARAQVDADAIVARAEVDASAVRARAEADAEAIRAEARAEADELHEQARVALERAEQATASAEARLDEAHRQAEALLAEAEAVRRDADRGVARLIEARRDLDAALDSLGVTDDDTAGGAGPSTGADADDAAEATELAGGEPGPVATSGSADDPAAAGRSRTSSPPRPTLDLTDRSTAGGRSSAEQLDHGDREPALVGAVVDGDAAGGTSAGAIDDPVSRMVRAAIGKAARAAATEGTDPTRPAAQREALRATGRSLR